jgi:hypothetical protein
MHPSLLVSEIKNFCLEYPRPLKDIARKFKLSIKSLYNFLSTKLFKDNFLFSKTDGIINILTNPTTIKPEQVARATKGHNPKYAPIEDLKRVSPERLNAVLKLNRIKDFGRFNLITKKFEYQNSVYQEVNSEFRKYCNRVNNESLVLTRTTNGNPMQGIDYKLPYKTRFTDKTRQLQNLSNFQAVWNKARKSYLKAVFLTLTIAPEGGESLYQANLRAKNAYRKFMRKIKYRFPQIKNYITVNEFQQNGRLHFHILIFGINWITTYKDLQRIWMSCNGGYMISVRGLKNTKQGWKWTRAAPSDSKGMQPGDYLESYLTKSMTKESGVMYWISGMRNWTASKALLSAIPKYQKPENPSKRFILKGIINSITGFRFSKRKDAVDFFAGNLIKSKPVKTEKAKAVPPTKALPGFTIASKITNSYIKNTRVYKED